MPVAVPVESIFRGNGLKAIDKEQSAWQENDRHQKSLEKDILE